MLTRLRARLRENGRPLRYLVAGGLNTLFGLGFYPALLWFSPWLARHYMTALVLSQVVCVLFAFTTYKIGVFRGGGSVVRQLGMFSTFYYAVFAVNLVALPLLVQGLGVRPIPAQLGFSIVTLVGSYFWHSAVTFRARTRA